MTDDKAIDLAKLFGRDNALDYDDGIRRRIPGYEALHATAYAVLAGRLASAARLLVVGAGSGHEMVLLGQARFDWCLVGVDPSSDMLAIARSKIAAAGCADRLEVRRGTAADLPTDDAFDAATALLVMHFLPDNASKRDFLVSIAARLKPGAPFLLADMTGVPGTPEFETLFSAWQVHFRRVHGPEVDDETMAKEFAQRRARPGWLDERGHFELFHQAGFVAPTLFWASLHFRAWVMSKR